jgi:hypothetical protein
LTEAAHRHVERVFDTSGKKTHWGMRLMALAIFLASSEVSFE